jgi:hypothetical protein
MGSGAPLLEVSARARADGQIPARNKIWCLRREANLESDYEKALREVMESRVVHDAPDNQRFAAMRQVFQQARGESGGGCGSWYEWVEYFDPTWHYEDWRMLELERSRQALARDIAELDLRSAEEQTKIAEQHAKTADALLELSRRSDDQTKRYNFLFAAIAVIALVLALGQIAYPNGIDGVHFPYAREELSTETAVPSEEP